MFKIIKQTIHVTRGDWGIIDFSIPQTNIYDHWKYTDADGKEYWYDSTNNELYDSEYTPCSIDLLDTLTLQLYEFQPNDVVRFKVFRKNDCSIVEIQKDVIVDSEKTVVSIELEKEDTKIGGLIKKPTDYWYEVELNPDTKPQTVIGFDISGEKIFKLYPEGDEQHVES